VWPFLLLLIGWVLYALWLLRRRGPGDVPRAVVSLIAGIPLVDAVILCGAGAVQLSIVAVAAFLLTLALQRVVPGT
jgi:4-hydroxybenzoate polyprenyltransferase